MKKESIGNNNNNNNIHFSSLLPFYVFDSVHPNSFLKILILVFLEILPETGHMIVTQYNHHYLVIQFTDQFIVKCFLQ